MEQKLVYDSEVTFSRDPYYSHILTYEVCNTRELRQSNKSWRKLVQSVSSDESF